MIFGRPPQRHRPVFPVKAVSFVGNDPAGDKYRASQDIDGWVRDSHPKATNFPIGASAWES
jgi:ATP-dependent DNA helicase RecG